MQTAHVLHRQLTRPAAAAGPTAQRRVAFSTAPLPRRRTWLRRRTAVSAKEVQEKDAEKQQQSDDSQGRYPERNAWTGGWAGGEKGLQAFIAEFDEEPTPAQKREVEKAAEKDPSIVKVEFKGKKVEARRIAQGEASTSNPIYIGMKKGAKDDAAPQYLVDDERKYPSRESLGPLSGIVGGFAGGERGVQQYVEKGEVEIAETGRKQSSPLVFALIVAVFGTAGALFLTNIEEVGEEIYETAEQANLSGTAASVSTQRSSLLGGLDPNTKLAIEAALAAAAIAALLYFGRKTASSLANNLREGVLNLGKLAAFWAVVVVAAKYVIEN